MSDLGPRTIVCEMCESIYSSSLKSCPGCDDIKVLQKPISEWTYKTGGVEQ